MMTGMQQTQNPFTVLTPEDMTAEETHLLFVDVFTDFPKMKEQGHAFIHGPRGSGKSMIFRYLQPDCQQIAHACSIPDLPFYGIYVPLKNTDLKLTELRRLEGKHASAVLNEHFMAMCIAERAFSSLAVHCVNCDQEQTEAIRRFIRDVLFGLLHACGWEDEPSGVDALATPSECFSYMQRICDRLFRDVILYLRRLSFSSDPFPFNGPLCGYLDFLSPLLTELKQLPFMPSGPIYLLIDDADNLSETQTMILNSWVSSRTSGVISIKISTQMLYRTYCTLTGQTIDAPHDYSEVNISTIYTTARKGTYADRLRAIVVKRLHRVGIDVTPEEFFPEDKAQEEAIRAIADELKAQWPEEGHGYRASDDALRYARPNFIRGLSGNSKSRPSYSYAGFEQMVHVSSGIIRHFLEAAAVMFSETPLQDGTITHIPPSIQNDVLRRQANEFLFNEFEKRFSDRVHSPGEELLRKLYNLLQALGGTFLAVLLSDRSERRVFSIAFSDTPSDDIIEVLRLGERYGYFHVSTIGNKEGTGRTRLYIMSRRLAPLFTLDPTSFAGYLFVTSEKIRQAMEDPSRLLRRIKTQGLDEMGEQRQLQLFD